MAVYEAWFRFWGEDHTSEPAIRDGLSAAGVQLAEFDEHAPAGHGIVAFGAVDDGLFEFLHGFRRNCQRRVLALSAIPLTTGTGIQWRLLNAGASEVLVWEGNDATEQVLAKLDRWQVIEALAAGAASRQGLIGESSDWQRLIRRVVEAAHFSRTPILLTGESGTGKELLARLIHAAGSAGTTGASRELVTVDCSTIVPELAGSELFGHERGAFTGAHGLREGAFALADGATLFLDEVGELPPALQAQLLRVIQEKTYKRVGGNVWMKTDFRLVCATNRDLADLVQRGQFRLDLYHRIAGWVFRTLNLRERPDDILPLARHFLNNILEDTPEFDPSVEEYLLNRGYDGNIRELSQLMQRIAHRHVRPGRITVGDIPEEDRPGDSGLARAWPDDQLDRSIAGAIAVGASLREISSATSDTAIRIAVQSEQGNLQRAARRLGVTDRALQMRRAAAGKAAE